MRGWGMIFIYLLVSFFIGHARADDCLQWAYYSKLPVMTVPAFEQAEDLCALKLMTHLLGESPRTMLMKIVNLEKSKEMGKFAFKTLDELDGLHEGYIRITSAPSKSVDPETKKPVATLSCRLAGDKETKDPISFSVLDEKGKGIENEIRSLKFQCVRYQCTPWLDKNCV